MVLKYVRIKLQEGNYKLPNSIGRDRQMGVWHIHIQPLHRQYVLNSKVPTAGSITANSGCAVGQSTP